MPSDAFYKIDFDSRKAKSIYICTLHRSTATFWVIIGLRRVNNGFCSVNPSQKHCEIETQTHCKFVTGFAGCKGSGACDGLTMRRKCLTLTTHR